MSKHPKLVCYFPINDPKIPTSFLRSYDLAKVDYIELGLKSNNAYLDGEIIRNSMKRSSGFGYIEECLKTIKAISKMQHSPKKVLFIYASEIYLGRKTIWKNFDVVLCPGRLGLLRNKILYEAKIQNTHNAEFIKYDFDDTDVLRAKSSSSYVMLQYLPGKTGLQNNFDKKITTRIKMLKDNGVSQPILLGIGVSGIDQVKHIMNSGADGVVIGSSILKNALIGENYLTDYLSKIRETLNEK